MRVGSLVARGGVTSKLNLGLVLAIYDGCTFAEAKVIWFNLTKNKKNRIGYYEPRFLRVIES